MTAIETKAAAVTVSDVEAEIVPDVAVMLATPIAAALASPWEPLALLIVAIPVAEELQTTLPVTFCVVPSVNVPVAVNC